jgi:hypothetical protein
MAQFFEGLSSRLIEFIRAQQVFFVASAAMDSRVNLSPKGLDTLRVLDETTVAYLDITGSGNETAAHVLHGGRITMMFCSFGEKPLILRLYGKGEIIRPHDPTWNDLIERFDPLPGQRQIVLLHIESIQTSCGFGVPRMELIEPRPTLSQWAAGKGAEGILEYRAKKNVRSIDGLPTGEAEAQAKARS